VREPTVPMLAPGMDLPRDKHRLPRPAFVMIAIFAGMFFAFALSTLLAGSANAAPETGLSSPILGQAGSVAPASTLAKHLSSVARSTSRRNLITSVASPTRVVTSVTTPVVHAVSSTVRPLVSGVARTVNRSIPAVAPANPFPGAAPKARTSAFTVGEPSRVGFIGQASPRLPAATTRVADGGDPLRSTLTTLGSPPAPPLRSPVLPTRNLPATPDIPGEGLPSGHGNGQFGSLLRGSCCGQPPSREGHP
jgi:hypothetical protein